MKQNATSFEDPARYIEISYYFWACSQNCEKQQFASSGLSVRPSVRIEQPGPQFTNFHEICSLSILNKKNCQENASFIKILTGITGTLHEDQCKCSIISHSCLLRVTNVSDQSCRENQKAHFVFNNFFF